MAWGADECARVTESMPSVDALMSMSRPPNAPMPAAAFRPHGNAPPPPPPPPPGFGSGPPPPPPPPPPGGIQGGPAASGGGGAGIEKHQDVIAAYRHYTAKQVVLYALLPPYAIRHTPPQHTPLSRSCVMGHVSKFRFGATVGAFDVSSFGRHQKTPFLLGSVGTKRPLSSLLSRHKNTPFLCKHGRGGDFATFSATRGLTKMIFFWALGLAILPKTYQNTPRE